MFRWPQRTAAAQTTSCSCCCCCRCCCCCTCCCCCELWIFWFFWHFLKFPDISMISWNFHVLSFKFSSWIKKMCFLKYHFEISWNFRTSVEQKLDCFGILLQILEISGNWMHLHFYFSLEITYLFKEIMNVSSNFLKFQKDFFRETNI